MLDGPSAVKVNEHRFRCITPRMLSFEFTNQTQSAAFSPDPSHPKPQHFSVGLPMQQRQFNLPCQNPVAKLVPYNMERTKVNLTTQYLLTLSKKILVQEV